MKSCGDGVGVEHWLVVLPPAGSIRLPCNWGKAFSPVYMEITQHKGLSLCLLPVKSCKFYLFQKSRLGLLSWVSFCLMVDASCQLSHCVFCIWCYAIAFMVFTFSLMTVKTLGQRSEQSSVSHIRHHTGPQGAPERYLKPCYPR